MKNKIYKKMVGAYYGNDVSQSNICKAVKGNTENATASDYEAVRAINYVLNSEKNIVLKLMFYPIILLENNFIQISIH